MTILASLFSTASYAVLHPQAKAGGFRRGSGKEYGTNPVARSTEALNTDPPTSAEPNAQALELFELLRDKRKMMADKEEVRAFRIFSDKILKEMVTHLPRTRETFRQIQGIGPAKMEKYADDFLPIIHAYCEEHGID